MSTEIELQTCSHVPLEVLLTGPEQAVQLAGEVPGNGKMELSQERRFGVVIDGAKSYAQKSAWPAQMAVAHAHTHTAPGDGGERRVRCHDVQPEMRPVNVAQSQVGCDGERTIESRHLCEPQAEAGLGTLVRELRATIGASKRLNVRGGCADGLARRAAKGREPDVVLGPCLDLYAGGVMADWSRAEELPIAAEF